MSQLIDPLKAPETSAGECDSRDADAPAPHPEQGQPAAQAGRLRMVASWLPSFFVMAALAAIAWYGHNHDWKLPSLSSSFIDGDSAVAWCDSHGVPEHECIVCRPSLIEESPKLTFCEVHGLHGCVLCVPSLAETKQPTAPAAADIVRAKRALELRPRTENLSIGSSPGSRIQFASIDAMKKAGVDVELVERRHVVEAISAAGEIRYDATKSAIVSPQADGIVRRVCSEIGTWVEQGDVLALIDSTDAGRLKTELFAALADERLRQATLERLRPLAGESIAGKRVLESENELQQARANVGRIAGTLGNLGITVDVAALRKMNPDQIEGYIQRLGLHDASIERTLNSAVERNLVAVIAPLSGQIVDRSATIGQVVDRGTELFRVVDTRSVWLDLRVPAEAASLVRRGLPLHFVPDGLSRQHSGSVTWISSDVDVQTRTVRVRAELLNEDQSLRNEMFGRGEIVLRDELDAIAVPETAVQWDGAGQIVFVRDARFFEEGRPKFFVSRSVRTGVNHDGFTEIIAGLLPGEVVATKGSDVLRAQLLKGNLGAGCTCAH